MLNLLFSSAQNLPFLKLIMCDVIANRILRYLYRKPTLAKFGVERFYVNFITLEDSIGVGQRGRLPADL